MENYVPNNEIKFHVPQDKKSYKFVGLNQKENNAEFVFPCQYLVDTQNKEQCKLEAKKLVKVIKGAYTNSLDYGNIQNVFQYFSMIWLIQDFMENGYFKEVETTTKIASKGKIDWQKTVKENNFWLDNNNIVYNKFARKLTITKEFDLTTEIYKFCLEIALKNFGWMFEVSRCEKSIFANTSSNRKMMVRFLKDKITKTYIDSKIMLFKNLYSILTNTQNNTTTSTFALTDREFEYVFEKLIDNCFGTENARDYYNEYEYVLLDGVNESFENVSVSRPDTICIDNKKMFILDAKYYGYGYTKSRYDLPQTSSIVKQFAYEKYLDALYGKKSEKKMSISSAFMLPCSNADEPIKYVGYAKAKLKEKSNNKEKIHVFLIDLKTLVETYFDSKLKQKMKREFIKMFSKI